MSKYPLDQNDMQEQYEDLLIKAALKEHARKESARLEQEAAGEAAVPPAEDNVIRAAFRRVTWEEARGTVLYGAKKAVSCVAVVFLTIAVAYHYLCPFPCGEKAEHPGAGAVYHPLLHR